MDLGASKLQKIAKTLAFVSLFAPMGAYALGIGEIRLHSALNEALNAEIPLVTSDVDELSDIRVSLASPEAFQRANIDRTYLLSRLRFNLKKKPDGSHVISVSSKETVSEPILNFMVEIYWPQGRMQREFTVLLDPPDSFQEADAPSEELPETEIDGRSRDQPDFSPAPQEPAPQESGRSRPRPVARKSRGNPVTQTEPETPASGTRYGPVSQNETLWGIAKRFQDPNLSQRQLLDAIYQANPQAFYQANINALKAGATLVIPGQAKPIESASSQDSYRPRRDTRNMVSANKKRSTEPTLAKSEEEPGTQGQLQLLAPSEGKSLNESATSGKRGKSKGGKSKEDLALELADTAKQENENFRKRLDDMEKQFSSMQKLLSLKDEQIAALQARQKPMGKEGQAPALGSIEPFAPPVTASLITPDKPTPPPLTEVAKPPLGAPLTKAQEPSQATQATAPPPPVVAPSPTANTLPTRRPDEAAKIMPPPRVASTSPAKPQSTQPTVPPSSEEEGFLRTLSQPYFLIGGATGLSLLFLLWQFKRRRNAMIGDAESILTLTDKEKTVQPKAAVAPEPVNIAPTFAEPSPAFRSSFLSEFSPSDFDALGGEMVDVDPISEADVYLAYSRYKQAEDLIINAIKQNPERDEFRLKLLEIHYATENAQAFSAYAEELAPTHKDAKPEFWDKVSEMGRELCHGNPLFSDNTPKPAGMPLPVESPAPAKAPTQAQNDINLFNAEEDDVESYAYPAPPPIVAEKPTAPADDDQSSVVAYDFFSTEEMGAGSIRETQDKLSKTQALDFDLMDIDNTVSFDNAITYPPVDEIEVPEESMEEILAKLGVMSESESKKLSSTKGQSNRLNDKAAVDQDDEAYQFSLEDAKATEPLEEENEIATRLDLAKAYYDLGDAVTARGILEHIIHVGNSAQQEEANSLLEKLHSKE